MSDVAFVAGLDESTVSRLWDDPSWLDRISGRSLQALAASVPGVAEYFASHSVLSRRDSLLTQLEAEGLVANRPALLLSTTTEVPHQYLINALEAALSIMRGDDRRAVLLPCSLLGPPAKPRARIAVCNSRRSSPVEEPRSAFHCFH